MTRPLAYVETVSSIKPVENAEKIELATILGFEVITKKDEFRVGDTALYIEVDSKVPELPCFEFLRPRNFKIKIIRLRGTFSYGIIFPLSIIQEITPAIDIGKLKVGDDLTEALGITQYNAEQEEPVEQEKLSWLTRKVKFLKWKLFGIKPQKSGGFPTHLVPKTDETRVQKCQGLLASCEGQNIYISEKCEGSSFSAIYMKTNGNWLSKLLNKGGTFFACSRNNVVFNSSKGISIEKSSTHNVVKLAIKYDLLNKMRKLNRNMAIQGEMCGGKIQGNIYKLSELELRVFSIYDIDKKAYVSYQELIDITTQMELSLVPIVAVDAPLINDVNYYLELAKGKSKLNPKVNREGLVCRAMDSSFSFKAINPEYILAQAKNEQ